MTEISQTLAEVIPEMYHDLRDNMRMPVSTNMAGSNQCHVLTRALSTALTNRGINHRREYHETSGDDPFHFVIAHTPGEAEPSEADLITDLNPWQFLPMVPLGYTYIHAPRHEVMQQLAEAGAPDYFVALRGLETIVHAHTDMPSSPRAR